MKNSNATLFIYRDNTWNNIIHSSIATPCFYVNDWKIKVVPRRMLVLWASQSPFLRIQHISTFIAVLKDMEPRNTPSSQLTILISLTAMLPFLVSLLLTKATVPWGVIFQPQDDLTYDMIGEKHLSYFTHHPHKLRPWANVSLHVGWTMVSIGTLYGLFVWCHFGTRERQRKVSTFMAAFVTVVTVLLFVFTACLCTYVYVVMLRYALDFRLYRFPLLKSMTATYFWRDSRTRNLWDRTQIAFECCGVTSFKNWTRFERDTVPDSCCKIHKPGCGKNFSLTNIYQRGCKGELAHHMKQQYVMQTQDEQIVYLLLAILLAVSAILITFISLKSKYGWMNNKREDEYVLVNNDDEDNFTVDVKEGVDMDNRSAFFFTSNREVLKHFSLRILFILLRFNLNSEFKNFLKMSLTY